MTSETTDPTAGEQACGDWPAPCNCDDPVTHNGHNCQFSSYRQEGTR